MKTTKLFSSVLIATILMMSLPLRKAQAGVLLTSASVAVSMNARGNYGAGLTALVLGVPAGVTLAVAGVITTFANPMLGVTFIILSEDGSLPQSELESVLAQKYSFIQDNKVIADLATLIKEKAEKTKEVEGKKMFSLSEAEVTSLLSATDLMETHSIETLKMISDLQ